MVVVLDTNVVMAAIFWDSPARKCLALFARRQFQIVVSAPILSEYVRTASELRRTLQRDPNSKGWLAWISNKSKLVSPDSLGKPVSSDPEDDKFIACALSAAATYIISRDARHLLKLYKPFGIEIITDRALLTRLQRR